MSISRGATPPPPHPLSRINSDDELINNILPSYHMFASTVSKNLVPTNENFRIDPPMYEMTPVTSTTNASLLPSQSLDNNSAPQEYSAIVQEGESSSNEYNQESADIWKNNILNNVDKLPSITNTKGYISDKLDVVITVTDKVCQKGIKPEVINPLQKEYNSGDYVHGYVTIRNTSDKPIPFDMVYVVFEGCVTVLDYTNGVLNVESEPITRFKFLNMLDLFASWSYANIDRLSTDNGDPYDWCDGEIDPYDNTLLSIDVKRLFQPNVTYKRYFTFRIPEKLLDNTCEEHSLNLHCEVPPTLGIDRNTVSPLQALTNKSLSVKDLAIIDTNVSYSIDARVIGKASDYNYKVERDQYLVAKKASCPIRVVPQSNFERFVNYNSLHEECQIYYKAFVDQVINKIEYGSELLNVSLKLGTDLLSPQISTSENDGNKLRQLYQSSETTSPSSFQDSKDNITNEEQETYQYMTSLKKKSLTGSSKHLGIISLSTPKTSYSINYVKPSRFGHSTIENQLKVPLELNYHTDTSSSLSLPQVKSVNVELVSLTIRSKKHPIPIEFTPEMCFPEKYIDYKGGNGLVPNFDHIIIKQFHIYLDSFHKLIKELGNDIIKIETQLYRDVKSLASLGTKYINLQIPDVTYTRHDEQGTSAGSQPNVKTIPWKQQDKSSYSMKFEVNLNLNSVCLKGNVDNNEITLVPSFQGCILTRIYYIKVSVKLSRGEVLVVNVPLTIQN
ncbi:Ubiquitin ligase-binding protein BUL2 [Spathaspora sp. JA1]|nr:Ubiquitin ligase-binding protein BUL2 [Spathaspora sp. JA1]